MVITIDPTWFVNIARVAILFVAGVDLGLILKSPTITPTQKYVTWGTSLAALVFVGLDLVFGLTK